MTAVQVVTLVKRYGKATAVDGVDLTIEPRTVYGLLGPNGAGKTTVIETVAGLRRPTSGVVRVFGLDPVTQRQALRRVVAMQPQSAALFPNLTAFETLRLWASLHEVAASPSAALASVGLTDRADTLVRRLSGGQQRRLLVATALIAEPRLLLLDEPSLGLDPNARTDLWDVVLRFRDDGGTVLLTTNAMEEAEALCERVSIIDRGRTVAVGTPAELVAAHAPYRIVSFAREPGHDRVDDWRAWPGVVGVDVRGGRVHLRTGTPERVVAALRSGARPARDVTVREPGLDDIFRVLTGRSLTAGDDGALTSISVAGDIVASPQSPGVP